MLLAQHCLPYSFPCCFLTPSAIKMIVYTSTPEVTETSLTLHNIKPRHQETLFADDTAVNAHPRDALQCPIFRFSRAESLASPSAFKRQPSWVKTSAIPYFSSSNLSLGTELNAQQSLGQHHADHEHQDLSVSSLHTHTLLHGSETWTRYSNHEAGSKPSHLHCLRRILGITWHDCPQK